MKRQPPKHHDDRLDKRLSKPIEYFTDADKFNIAMAVATGKKDPKDILVMQPKLTDQMIDKWVTMWKSGGRDAFTHRHSLARPRKGRVA
jgi:hypothetical protein